MLGLFLAAIEKEEARPSNPATSAVQLDNVLLHEGLSDGRPTVRLCDFGSSTLDALNSMCRSYTGTYEYMAPEVLFESQVCQSLCLPGSRTYFLAHVLTHVGSGRGAQRRALI